MSTVATVEKQHDPEEEQRLQRVADKPALAQCYNLMDFEAVAKKVIEEGRLGLLDMSTVATVEKQHDPEEEQRLQRVADKPALAQCYNLMDFEAVAKKVMRRGAWGYWT